MPGQIAQDVASDQAKKQVDQFRHPSGVPATDIIAGLVDNQTELVASQKELVANQKTPLAMLKNRGDHREGQTNRVASRANCSCGLSANKRRRDGWWTVLWGLLGKHGGR